MAEDIVLNNYSDDSQIKKYISDTLLPRVFHDVPLNILNTGHLSLINEYMSQVMEQQAYTSSFYFNEAFITKAVLPDSIYAEAAIFNIGYSFASPSVCNFLFELKIEDIYANATLNTQNGLYEFIIDKNTKFNMSNGSIYSLDYDILIQYKSIETSKLTSTIAAWNVQYTNLDPKNSISVNKNIYILHRVTDVWLCMFVTASEYERHTYTVVNNMTNGIPNEDKVITCDNHICGFDIKYIDGNNNETYLETDHILPIHSNVTDNEPYIHYIMENPQTIRFMFQLNGNKYFVPTLNSSFEITIYTCHGEAANFDTFDANEQPSVLTSSNKYSNNANVMKAAWIISPSTGGTNIGTTETTRRETIEAYNTANVISSDHDIEEWFKTFLFKNVLYPFFFKRRDDPWGRIWSGYIALKDDDDYIFRTNTLHGKIKYESLYANNDNTISENEIVIPPGWIWTYGNENRYTVVPYTTSNSNIIETAKTLASINEKFIFANPFGIRIQKSPFAIGYFNPWVNEFVTATRVTNINLSQSYDSDTDISTIYHASPLTTHITRTYLEDYYKISTHIVPTISSWINGNELIDYVRQNAVAPAFVTAMWSYFNQPLDLYSANIPMLPLVESDGYLPFNPDLTYFCVRTKNKLDGGTWSLEDIWIDDMSEIESKRIYIPITGDITMLYGDDSVWGDNGLCKGYEVYFSGDVNIGIYPTDTDYLQFERIATQNYYELRLSQLASTNTINKIIVTQAVVTELTKYGENYLVKIGQSYGESVVINVQYANGLNKSYTITNYANIYMPYEFTVNSSGQYEFDMSNLGSNGIILYADMRPAPNTGAVDYYRVPFSAIVENTAMFYISNKLLPLQLNNMRVILHAMINGSETGRVEMQPIMKESDGSYEFEVNMYTLNQMVDIDNRINIASTSYGGGNWIPTVAGSTVSIDATNPEFKISILVRSQDSSRDSDITIGDTYTGFRLIDQYTLDDVALIQELKEMRSVVNFSDTSIPTDEQIVLYYAMLNEGNYNGNINGNIYTIINYAYDKMHDTPSMLTYNQLCDIVKYSKSTLNSQLIQYKRIVSETIPDQLTLVLTIFGWILTDQSNSGSNVNWTDVYTNLSPYKMYVNDAFEQTNVNGGVEIQLMPFVEYSLMNSERFESFVSAFTQIHKSIEPIINQRLEGNNYLDCKLIATYGLPHSYSSDVDCELENVFWPDLNVQLEFNVKLYNSSLSTNTLNELRTIIKSYFNRLTSIHTPVDLIAMNSNIYISHVIQQMESHSNVAYLKFIGWYTNEKDIPDGAYMDANIQCITQKWKSLEDFPKEELERFTPEMFVLEDKNIVINVL